MKPIVIFCTLAFLALTGGGPLFSAVLPENAEPDGPALARELRNLQPAEAADLTARLMIRRPKSNRTETVPIHFKVVPSEKHWESIYEVRTNSKLPAEKLIVRHATNQPNQYWHARASSPTKALPELTRLSGPDINQPFASSDFLLSDLGLEFYHWPTQVQRKGEMRKGQPCYVLESSNPDESSSGYRRVLSWVDKESGGLLIAEAFNAKRQVKEFSVKSVKKVDGRWKLDEMEIRTLPGEGRTILKFDYSTP